MRISDWSSDVCSSDLPVLGTDPPADLGEIVGRLGQLVGLAQPPLRSQQQPVGDVVVQRAVHLTERHAALRAAAGLLGSRLGIELVVRSEEHTSELQSLMRISYAVFCLKKKKTTYIQYNKPTLETTHK